MVENNRGEKDIKRYIDDLEKNVDRCDSNTPKLARTYTYLTDLLHGASEINYNQWDNTNKEMDKLTEKFAENCSCSKRKMAIKVLPAPEILETTIIGPPMIKAS